MNSKLIFTLSIFVIILCSNVPKSSCADAYTSASYGLSHSKKAFTAHNFDHQKYYAGRALEALEKTRDLVGECGCTGAMNAIEDGIENMEEAQDPVDWKMGRYYTKRAMENTYSILENLDMCSTEAETSTENTDTAVDEPALQISEEAEITAVEFDQDLEILEQSTQAHLKELNSRIKELCALMGCESNASVLEQSEIEKSKDGSFASLEEAQVFYRKQAAKAYQQVASHLQQCGGKQ